MAMGARTAMSTVRQRMSNDSDVMTLAQWLSPAFPVGAFAYSHGLETAIAEAMIVTAQDLEGWLAEVLEHGSGRTDAIVLRAAYANPADLVGVNDAALAFAATSERVMETELQGTAFGQTTAAIWGGEGVAFCYPVAVGAAAARRHLDADLTVTLYLQAFAANLVSAAVRGVPLGQTEGQRVLAALAPICAQIAEQSRDMTLEDLHSTAFASDIAAMRHETLQPRIFRS